MPCSPRRSALTVGSSSPRARSRSPGSGTSRPAGRSASRCGTSARSMPRSSVPTGGPSPRAAPIVTCGSGTRRDGRHVGLPMPHGDIVTALAFAPEGRLLISGSEEGTVRLWDIETCKSIGPPLPRGPDRFPGRRAGSSSPPWPGATTARLRRSASAIPIPPCPGRCRRRQDRPSSGSSSGCRSRPDSSSTPGWASCGSSTTPPGSIAAPGSRSWAGPTPRDSTSPVEA